MRCPLDCSFISRLSVGVDLATLPDVESLLMKVTMFVLSSYFLPSSFVLGEDP